MLNLVWDDSVQLHFTLMASKDELQNKLKSLYCINKNISQPLSKAECEILLDRIEHEPSFAKLIEIYADKNSTLGKNNAVYGRAKNQAEQRYKVLQIEFEELEASIAGLESTNQTLVQRKKQLEEDRSQLTAEIQKITAQNQGLEVKVTELNVLADELTDANDQLKQENKYLKNIVDSIRLRLAKDVRQLLNYEDSEIRKALIKLYKSTLG
jgi:uncharacterized protein YoxC